MQWLSPKPEFRSGEFQPLLRGSYRRGVKFLPKSYLSSANPDDLLRAVIFSQPIAAGASGLMEYMASR